MRHAAGSQIPFAPLAFIERPMAAFPCSTLTELAKFTLSVPLLSEFRSGKVDKVSDAVQDVVSASSIHKSTICVSD